MIRVRIKRGPERPIKAIDLYSGRSLTSTQGGDTINICGLQIAVRESLESEEKIVCDRYTAGFCSSARIDMQGSKTRSKLHHKRVIDPQKQKARQNQLTGLHRHRIQFTPPLWCEVVIIRMFPEHATDEFSIAGLSIYSSHLRTIPLPSHINPGDRPQKAADAERRGVLSVETLTCHLPEDPSLAQMKGLLCMIASTPPAHTDTCEPLLFAALMYVRKTGSPVAASVLRITGALPRLVELAFDTSAAVGCLSRKLLLDIVEVDAESCSTVLTHLRSRLDMLGKQEAFTHGEKKNNEGSTARMSETCSGVHEVLSCLLEVLTRRRSCLECTNRAWAQQIAGESKAHFVALPVHKALFSLSDFECTARRVVLGEEGNNLKSLEWIKLLLDRLVSLTSAALSDDETHMLRRRNAFLQALCKCMSESTRNIENRMQSTEQKQPSARKPQESTSIWGLNYHVKTTTTDLINTGVTAPKVVSSSGSFILLSSSPSHSTTADLLAALAACFLEIAFAESLHTLDGVRCGLKPDNLKEVRSFLSSLLLVDPVSDVNRVKHPVDLRSRRHDGDRLYCDLMLPMLFRRTSIFYRGTTQMANTRLDTCEQGDQGEKYCRTKITSPLRVADRCKSALATEILIAKTLGLSDGVKRRLLALSTQEFVNLCYHDEKCKAHPFPSRAFEANLQGLLQDYLRLKDEGKRLLDPACVRIRFLARMLLRDKLVARVLERVWRFVVHSRVTAFANQEQSMHLTATDATQFMGSLCALYNQLDKVCRTELFVDYPAFHLTTSKGFESAYRYLPHQIAEYIAEMMVICLDSVLNDRISHQRSSTNKVSSVHTILSKDSSDARCFSELPGITRQTVTVFGSLKEHSDFWPIYEQYLASRLLEDRSISLDNEKSLLDALCAVSSDTPTRPLLMLQDIHRSSLLQDHFSRYLLRQHDECLQSDAFSTAIQYFEKECFSVKVLGQPNWRWVTAEGTAFTLPPLMGQLAGMFEEFYSNWTARGDAATRRLVWTVAGSAQLSFRSLDDQTFCTLQVSTLQMCILHIFNSVDSMSLPELLDRIWPHASTGLSRNRDSLEQLLSRELLPLAAADNPILVADDLEKSSSRALSRRIYRINRQFRPVDTSFGTQATRHSDARHSRESVKRELAWRDTLIDASVVRIAKRVAAARTPRGGISREELIERVTAACRPRFSPNAAHIERRVSRLVEKGYLREIPRVPRFNFGLQGQAGDRFFDVRYMDDSQDDASVSFDSRPQDAHQEERNGVEESTKDDRGWPYRQHAPSAGPHTDAALLCFYQRLGMGVQSFYTQNDIGSRREFQRVDPHIRCITANAPYQNISLDELRLQDYTGMPINKVPLPRQPLFTEIHSTAAQVDRNQPPKYGGGFDERGKHSQICTENQATQGGPSYKGDGLYNLSDTRKAPAHILNVARSQAVSLGFDDLLEKVQQLTTWVGAALGLEYGQAQRVLLVCRWNVRDAVHRYFEAEKQLREQAGLPLDSSCQWLHEKHLPSKEPLICGVCFEAVDRSHAYAMWCGHVFCRDCWIIHISATAKAHGWIKGRCMEHGCKAALTQEVIDRFARTINNGLELQVPSAIAQISSSTLGNIDTTITKREETAASTLVRLTSEELSNSFSRFLVADLVSAEETLHWCPNPRCESALLTLCLESTNTVLTCSKCQISFCAQCEYQDHKPASCSQMRQWEEQGGYVETKDEGKTNRRVIALTTKACPTCREPIVKDGGCPRVTCYKCGHRFCWSCLGPRGSCVCKSAMTEHTLEKRGRESHLVTKQIDFQLLGRAQEFEHLNKRCVRHSLAREYAEKLVRQTTSSLEQAREPAIVADLGLSLRACQLLGDVRRVLSHACVMRFYMIPSSERGLFDFRFQDLEHHADTMQSMIEQNQRFSRMYLDGLRRRLQTLLLVPI